MVQAESPISIIFPMSTSSKTFISTIDHVFKDASLLALALTHPSCDLPEGNNQRLEFLGDAVLDLITAERLFHDNPTVEEGTLDRMRANIVNGRSLAAAAKAMELDKNLNVSAAQRQRNVKPTDAMLEDAFEALIGALYLDGGLSVVRSFIGRALGETFLKASNSSDSGNPKGKLQEWAQQIEGGSTPEYSETSADGPDHAKIYTSTVYLGGKELGVGSGSSKKAAESAAALSALKRLKI